MVNIIIDFISETQKIDKSLLSADTNIIRDIEMSSFDVMDMCCQLEEQYGIEIIDEDLVNIQTIGEIALYIEEKLK